MGARDGAPGGLRGVVRVEYNVLRSGAEPVDHAAQWLPSTCTLTEYDSCVTSHKLGTQIFHTLGTSHAKKRIAQWNGCEQGIRV